MTTESIKERRKKAEDTCSLSPSQINGERRGSELEGGSWRRKKGHHKEAETGYMEVRSIPSFPPSVLWKTLWEEEKGERAQECLWVK